MARNGEELLTLEIRKYQNRRYYDTTRRQHVSLQQIHGLIKDGYNIRIVDAQTEEDITAKILTQILLDYEPLKLEVFSTELLLQAIRVNDRLLKDFVDLYFRQAFTAFCASQNQFKEMLREARQLTTALANPATWLRGLFPPWMHFGESSWGHAAPSAGADAATSGEQAVKRSEAEEIAALRKQIAELEKAIKEGAAAPKKRTEG